LGTVLEIVATAGPVAVAVLSSKLVYMVKLSKPLVS
jgi:hypothetical protein